MGDNSHPDKLVASNKDYEAKLKWVAVYQDGEPILQYTPEGQQSSEEIDHARLHLFHLVKMDDETPLYTLRVLPGQQFFYRARTAMRQAAGVLDRIHIVGVRDAEYRFVAFISEADMSVEVGDFVAKEDVYAQLRPWLYEINWRDIDDIVTGRSDQSPDTEPASE